MLPTIAAKKNQVKVVAVYKESPENVVFYNSNIDSENFHCQGIREEVVLVCEKVKTYNPDVVYIFGRPDPFYLVYNLKHSFPDVPLIYDVRSPLLVKEEKRKQDIKQQYEKLELYVDFLLTSDHGALKTYFEPRLYNCRLLPIGLNVSKIIPRSSPPKSISKFVFVGSLEKKRKIKDLIEGFVEFYKKAGRNVSLDIIGDGGHRQALQDFSAKLPGGDCVRFLGFLPQNEVFNKLKEYDCGIAYVPYERYDEAPSLKSIEYAAAKLPVLASDTSAHKRYSQDYGFGFNFFSNDVKAMAEDFASFFSRLPSVENIEATRAAAEQFDWERIFESTLTPIFASIETES